MLSATACEPSYSTEEEKDRLLAQVGAKSLHISEMEGMFPEGISGEDSTLIIESYVSRWVRETAILNEAERNIPDDLNINKMVRDYRASLVRSNYEKILVKEMLDTTVTADELKSFYEENQLLYELQKPIVRCLFLKVPMPTPEQDRLRKIWNKAKEDSLEELQAYADQYAQVALLQKDLWYAVEEVASQLPEGTLTVGNVGSKREFTQRDEHHQYYFRLFELKNRKEIAPLSYVEEQARKVIVHKRKLLVVEEVKEQIYQRELRDKNVETFY